MKAKVLFIASLLIAASLPGQTFAWGWGDYAARVLIDETIKQGVGAAINGTGDQENNNEEEVLESQTVQTHTEKPKTSNNSFQH